jgi:hypothetical protein
LGAAVGYNSKSGDRTVNTIVINRIGVAGRTLLLLIAALAWCAVLLQLWLSAQLARGNGGSALDGVLQALCYFTVLTNLLVALVASVWLARGVEQAHNSGMLAACAVYICVVGLIYSLLLRSIWAPTGLQKLADELLHDVVPAGYVLWWLGFAPKARRPWRATLLWLAYPLAYIAFSTARGLVTGRYPYPFADIGQLGILAVARNAVLMLGLFALLGLGAIAVERQSARRAAAGRGLT